MKQEPRLSQNSHLAAVLAVALVALLVGCAGTTGGDGGSGGGGEATADSQVADSATAADAGGSEQDAGAATDAPTGADSATMKDAATADTAGSGGGDPDVSAPDTAAPDTSATDAISPDTAGADATAADIHSPDAGNAADIYSPDAGAPDAGNADAGTIDAGTIDAGTIDAGPAPGGGCCKVDAHCEAGKVCFFGPFNAGKCMDTTKLPKGQCWTDAQCGTGLICTDAMACGCDAKCKAMDKPGVCKPANPCATVKCGDGNACTSDACDPKTGKCVFKPLTGTACDDGNACTIGDTCDISAKGDAICAPGKAKVCLTKPCTTATCDPKTGTCYGKEIPGCNYGKTCSMGLGAPTIDCGKDGYCKLPSSANCVGFGVCAPKPTMCTKEYKPVCACDKKTYSNACMAALVGQNTQDSKACGAGGCCSSDATCGAGAVCIGSAKAKLAGKGQCKKLSELSKGQCWDDGQCGSGTCSGASVCPCGALCILADKPGMCSTPPSGCKVGDNTTCAAGQYCSGPCGGTGTCAPKPGACTMQFDPVCGCNGKTYGNACSAASAGVSVKAKGACGIKPPGCCKQQIDCPYKDDICVGASTGKGICKNTKKLQMGQCWTDAQCGAGTCKGASICPCGAQCLVADKPGTCTKPAGACVVGGKNTCQANEFCDGICGANGSCTTKPKICFKIYKPVCGCDHKTYGNSCEAHAQGVAVQSKGPCAP